MGLIGQECTSSSGPYHPNLRLPSDESSTFSPGREQYTKNTVLNALPRTICRNRYEEVHQSRIGMQPVSCTGLPRVSHYRPAIGGGNLG
jgi:hypothetical protein